MTSPVAPHRHSPSTVQLLRSNPPVPGWQFSLIVRWAMAAIQVASVATAAALAYGACSASDRSLAKMIAGFVLVSLAINVLDIVHSLPQWRQMGDDAKRMATSAATLPAKDTPKLRAVP